MQTEESESKYFQSNTLTRSPRKIVARENHELSSSGRTALQMKALLTLNVEVDLNRKQFAKRLKMGKTGAMAMVNRPETLGPAINNPNRLTSLTKENTFSDKTYDLNPKIQKTIIDEKNLGLKI